MFDVDCEGHLPFAGYVCWFGNKTLDSVARALFGVRPEPRVRPELTSEEFSVEITVDLLLTFWAGIVGGLLLTTGFWAGIAGGLLLTSEVCAEIAGGASF